MFGKLWKEIRGNALWDGIKWLWCAGGSALTIGVQAVLGFVRGHQDLTAIVISLIPFAILTWIGLRFTNRQSSQRTASPVAAPIAPALSYDRQLRIHRAFYGAGHVGGDDCDVTDKLKALPLNALAVRVQNELADKDPASGREKRLEVRYSYGNETERTARCGEYRLLVVPQTDVVPMIGITLDLVVIEAYCEGLNYPRKIRVYFRENAGDVIALKRPRWEPQTVGIQRDKPFGCYYELEGTPGNWVNESAEVVVPKNRRFRLYVGLDSMVPETDLQRFESARVLGTLVIPAEVLGINVELRIKI